jgi:hypothetical protein
MNPYDNVLPAYIDTFYSQKELAEKAISQVSDELLRTPPDANTNSIAVIMKHISGNLRSRFTDFLHTDGEKPWRDRDDEFIDNFRDRAEIIAYWEAGWDVLFECLKNLRHDHLAWDVTIRGEAHSVPHALDRALAHVGYHTGQIVLTARFLCKDSWSTITVPRGGSKQFNRDRGFEPGAFDDHET